MKAPARSRGFTLIELMVTLTILAIMAGIAVPAFRTFMANQRVRSASQELVSSVLLARSEAIKRNSPVTMTPAETETWLKGWSVAAGATTVHMQAAVDSVTITQKDASNNAVTPAAITFGNTGRPAAIAYFQVSGSGDAIRCIRLDAAGIPSSSNRSCS